MKVRLLATLLRALSWIGVLVPLFWASNLLGDLSSWVSPSNQPIKQGQRRNPWPDRMVLIQGISEGFVFSALERHLGNKFPWEEWTQAGNRCVAVKLDSDWTIDLTFRSGVLKAWSYREIKPRGWGAFADLHQRQDVKHYSMLTLIQRAPRCDPDTFDSVALIRVVNALRKHSRATIVDSLLEYQRLTRLSSAFRYKYDLDESRIVGIAAILFIPKKGISFRDVAAHFGSKEAGGEKDVTPWPLFPLILHNDLPILPVCPRSLIEKGDRPILDLDWYSENCVIRTSPLKPEKCPLTTVNELVASTAWRTTFPQQRWSRSCQLVRRQALRTLRSADCFGQQEIESLTPLSFDGRADALWVGVGKSVAPYSVRWCSDSSVFQLHDQQKRDCQGARSVGCIPK